LRIDETHYIRGRKVVFERREPVEHLPFTLDAFDARDNFIEVLKPALTPTSVSPKPGTRRPSSSILTSASACARRAA
jgi:hypothetical protein